MKNLPPLNIRYPYDPTGKSPDNFVEGEHHTIPPVNNRIIVPRLGAFYADSLEIDTVDRKLIRGVDYELAALYHDATVETGQDVNVMIYFSNLEITGDIYIHYQVVGGQFTGVWESIQQYVNVLLVDPRKIRWDDVKDKPELFAPKEHFHDINDVYGLNHLIPKLEEMIQAILRIRSKGFRKVYDTILKIKKDADALAAEITKIVTNNVKLVKDLTRQLNDEKEKVKALTARVTRLENDNTLKEEIKKLKAKDVEFANKFIQLTQIANRLETELGKKAKVVHNVTNQFFNNVGIDTVDNTDGFITGTLRPVDMRTLKIPENSKKAGERDFVGTTVQKDNKLTVQEFHLGEGEHYISSVDMTKNPNERVTEKVITDWSLQHDKNVRKLLVSTEITESNIAYVDAEQGNDVSGDGTWQKPYRSFDKAFEKINIDNKFGVIRLKEGQTHRIIFGTSGSWTKYTLRSPGLVIDVYGPETNKAIGYTSTDREKYPVKLWTSLPDARRRPPETILHVDNTMHPVDNARTRYVFAGFYNETTIYLMYLTLRMSHNASLSGYTKSLVLMSTVNDNYLYSYYSKFNLEHEYSFISPTQYTGRRSRVYIEEPVDTAGRKTLALSGSGKVFLPISYSNDYNLGDNNVAYDGASFFTSDPILYTDEVLERYFPKLKHGSLTWNSNFTSNIRRVTNKIPANMIPLSKQPGNLLVMREDGPYYGIEAPPDTTRIYVDALNGLDTNPGTREQPLKTIFKAWTIDTQSGVRSIYLYEGQNHIINKQLSTRSAKHRAFELYGPRYDAIKRSKSNNWLAVTSQEAFDLNTRVTFAPNYTHADAGYRMHRLYENIIDNLTDLTLEFRGMKVIKLPHTHLQKLANRENEPSTGYPYAKSSYVGLDYSDNAPITWKFVNCNLIFERNGFVDKPNFKLKDNNFFFNGVGGSKFAFYDSKGEVVQGDGLLFAKLKPEVSFISSSGFNNADIVRRYLSNVKNNISGLENLGSEQYAWFSRALPLSDDFPRVKHKIRFEDADQPFKVYYGSRESTYTTGELQFSYTTNMFKFTKPVTNDRGQVLGVSNAPGNLITMRSDGAYYGIEAPPDTSNLYVSPSGNDSNPGTLERPLRTIKEAMSRPPNGASSSITLMLGTHDWPDRIDRADNSFKFIVHQTSQRWQNDNRAPYFRPYLSRDYPRPIINVNKFVKNETVQWVQRRQIYAKNLAFFGIHFKLDDNNPANTPNAEGHIPGFVNCDKVDFYGCILDISGNPNGNNPNGRYRIDSWIRTNRCRLTGSDIRGLSRESTFQGNYSKLLYGANSPSLFVNSWSVQRNLVPGHTGSDDTTLVSHGQIVSKLNYNNVCNGIYVDAPTKTVRGISVNFDLFN